MKKEIHPKYYKDAKVTCACGNTFTVGSTLEDIRVELCSTCHPFYTGKQKFVDTAHRVEKFKTKVENKAKSTVVRKGKTAKRAAKTIARKARTEKAVEKK